MKPGSNALPALADQIRAEHDAAKQAAQTATEHAIRCGELLNEAKSGVDYGQWGKWLTENCDLSVRTAQAYMRLGRHHAGMDDAEAQRVAHLPIRQALRTIADEQPKVTPPAPGASNDEIWEWAGQQTAAPFNSFDMDHFSLMSAKMIQQLGFSAVTAFCLETATNEIPMTRLISNDEIRVALMALAPLAKGGKGGLEIDYKDSGDVRDSIGMDVTITISAQRLFCFVFNEIEYREKHYKTDKAWQDNYRGDCDEVLAAFLASREAELAKLHDLGGEAYAARAGMPDPNMLKSELPSGI